MLKQTESDLIDLLTKVKEVLDQKGIEFWLDCGTLLGAVRENAFLSWEDDIDIGCYELENDLAFKMNISSHFIEHGYSSYFTDSHINIRAKGKNNKTVLDINFYKRQNDTVVKPSFVPLNKIAKIVQLFIWSLYDSSHLKVKNDHSFKTIRNIAIIIVPTLLFHLLPLYIRQVVLKKIARIQHSNIYNNKSWVVPFRYFNTLSVIKFMGLQLLIPEDSEDYLEYRYGPDWRTPKMEWVTINQDGACTTPTGR